MGKHILVVSQYFYPEEFRINDICLELVKKGFKVTVVTGIPNYPKGKFYKGYGLFKKRNDTWNGIDIIRLPIISRGKSSLRLILNYYSFVFFGWFWSKFTSLKTNYVFTFEVSPMTQAKVGVWFSKRRHIPNYLYVQDLWPDNLEIVGGIKNKCVLDHYAKMSKKIYDNCDVIFATSPSFVSTIKERIVNNKEKVMYLPQYAEDFYHIVKRTSIEEIKNSSNIKVIFTGNIGYAQGLDILPKVASYLKNENIEFIVVGDGRYKELLIAEIKELNVGTKFTLIGKQPAERIPQMLACCDYAFLSFQKNQLFEKTIPAKLQSYMACGMPIIAVASGETKRIIEESRCGICIDSSEPEMIAKKIISFLKEDKGVFSKNSINYSNEYFNKDKIIDYITQYFK